MVVNEISITIFKHLLEMDFWRMIDFFDVGQIAEELNLSQKSAQFGLLPELWNFFASLTLYVTELILNLIAWFNSFTDLVTSMVLPSKTPQIPDPSDVGIAREEQALLVDHVALQWRGND